MGSVNCFMIVVSRGAITFQFYLFAASNYFDIIDLQGNKPEPQVRLIVA